MVAAGWAALQAEFCKLLGMPAPLPLSPYAILDLAIARAGPTAVRLLADWGANVIRIEAQVVGLVRLKARSGVHC